MEPNWQISSEWGLELFALPGIYALRCKATGEAYVGMTTRPISKRLKEHMKALSEGIHTCHKLQDLFDTYDDDNAFDCFVMSSTSDPVELKRLERMAMAWLMRLGYLLNQPTARLEQMVASDPCF